MKVDFFKQSLINLLYKDKFFDNVESLFDGSTSLVNGSFTQLFENNFSHYLGASSCSFVSNGLDALVLALEALDIGNGDTVIVPNHTYIATWLAPLKLGCKLIVAPVNDKTLLLDTNQINNFIDTKVKAVMPVHLYGNPCNIKQLREIQKQYSFSIIEDAAQAHSTLMGNQYVGNLGDLTCFSFYPTKNLGALGEAGAITTNDIKLHEKIVSLRNYGRSPLDGAINQYCGMNRRGDELQAAFLLEKLKTLDHISTSRKKLISIYASYLKNNNSRFKLIPYDQGSSPHLAVLQSCNCSERDKLREFLFTKGIQTSIHYRVPCHAQPFINLDQLIIADSSITQQATIISDTIISLPLSEVHTEDEIYYVCDMISLYEKQH